MDIVKGQCGSRFTIIHVGSFHAISVMTHPRWVDRSRHLTIPCQVVLHQGIQYIPTYTNLSATSWKKSSITLGRFGNYPVTSRKPGNSPFGCEASLIQGSVASFQLFWLYHQSCNLVQLAPFGTVGHRLLVKFPRNHLYYTTRSTIRGPQDAIVTNWRFWLEFPEDGIILVVTSTGLFLAWLILLKWWKMIPFGSCISPDWFNHLLPRFYRNATWWPPCESSNHM